MNCPKMFAKVLAMLRRGFGRELLLLLLFPLGILFLLMCEPQNVQHDELAVPGTELVLCETDEEVGPGFGEGDLMQIALIDESDPEDLLPENGISLTVEHEICTIAQEVAP